MKWIDSLDKSDPCWELFTYHSILNEARYLSRAVKCLKTGFRDEESKEKSDETAKSHFEELELGLETIDSDVTRASEFVKGTIDMVNLIFAII